MTTPHHALDGDHSTHTHDTPHRPGPYTSDDIEATICATRAAIDANLCHGLNCREPDLWGWDLNTGEVIIHDPHLHATRLLVQAGDIDQQSYIVAHFPEPTGGAWTICAPIASDRKTSAERIMRARFSGRTPADKVDLSLYTFPDADRAA